MGFIVLKHEPQQSLCARLKSWPWGFRASVKELSLFLHSLDPGWSFDLLECGRNDTAHSEILGPKKTCSFISLLSVGTLHPSACESARASLLGDWWGCWPSYPVPLTNSQPTPSHVSEALDGLLPTNTWASPVRDNRGSSQQPPLHSTQIAHPCDLYMVEF